MTHTPLKIGDPWPFRSARGLTGKLLRSPVWYGLVVPPQSEAKVKKQLTNAQIEVAYPEDPVVRHRNGKRYETTKPMISGVVYAKFDALPHWDALKQRRIITGVFCRGVEPVEIPDQTVRIICDLPSVEDELEKARIQALTPEEGEKVMLRGGLFDGFRVDVIRSEFGRVWYQAMTDIGPLKGETTIHDVQRLAGE